MASNQIPVGSVEITSYHDFPDFVQSVPEIARGFNLPVVAEPVLAQPTPEVHE